MIATTSVRRAAYAGVWRLVGVGLLVFLSLCAVVVALLLQEYAAIAAVACLVVALTLWRPRYGLYAALFLALAFEGASNDPFMFPGVVAQGDVSSWTPVRFINFTPIEFLVALVGLLVVIQAVVDRRLPKLGQLVWPILIFQMLLFASVAYGILRGGGSFNIALWEIRDLAVFGLLALLIPIVLRRREYVDTLLNLLTIGAVLLSIDLIWRRYTLLSGYTTDQLVLQYGHETPIFLNTIVLLLVARLIWPASRGARLWALTIPLLLYGEAVTGRRAGWVTLDVGMILMVIFIFRLKRRTFWLLIVPLALLYGGYLAAFWNANGAIAEPARAVRSLRSPDTRDASSNAYRAIETLDIRLNIKAHPITGLGMGQPFAMVYPLPDVGSNWPFWHFTPHNAFLWLWMAMGPTGFVAFITLVGLAIARGTQLLKRAAQSRSAPALAALVGALLMILVYSYVDIGLTTVRVCALLGLAVGVIAAWGRDAEPLERAESAPAPVPISTGPAAGTSMHAVAAAAGAGNAVSARRGAPIRRDRAPVIAASVPDRIDRGPLAEPRTGRAVARGAIALLATQPLTWAASLATVALMPHYLGADSFGAFAVAFTISTVFVTLLSLGMPVYLKRQVAEDPAHAARTTGDALFLLMAQSAIAAAGAWVALPLFVHDFLILDATRYMLVASVFVVGLNVLYAYMNGRGQYQRYAWLNAVISVVPVVIELAVLARGGGLHQLVVVGAVLNGVACAVIWLICGLPRPSGLAHWRRVVALWRAGLPFVSWDVTMTIRARADVVIIAALLGPASAAWLSAAYRIVAIPLFVSTAVSTPLLPALARCLDDRDVFSSVLFDSLLSVVLITLPASVGIFILAQHVPTILHWPADFASSVIPMRILAVQPTLLAADVILGTAIFAAHREHRWLLIGGLATLFSVTANFVAQPLAHHAFGNGATGAAIVEDATEAIFFVGALALIPATYRPRGLWLLLLRACVCGAAMAAVGVVCLRLSLAVAVVASTATYFAAALLTGFLRRDHILRSIRAVYPLQE